MGQLTSALRRQAAPWKDLLALRTLTGQIPNPIDNATEVDDTRVYFHREHNRFPSRPEWEAYTRAYAVRKKWDWRPEQIAFDQFGHNVLFVTTAARGFPEGATRILPPSPVSASRGAFIIDGGSATKAAPVEPAATVPLAAIEVFAAKLAPIWSRGRNGSPSVEAFRAWLIKDHQDSLEGARSRYGTKVSASSVSRAWMISREEQMKFQTLASKTLKPPRDFSPPATPSKRISDTLISGGDKAPVAPAAIRFVQELHQRHARFNAWTYRGHGGGAFLDQGYSIDLDLGRDARDSRGFFRPVRAIEFLRAVGDAARALNAEWRILYNDFLVADAINRETGYERVFFIGAATKDKKNIIWHGPAPLILHFHLDLVPR